MDRVTRLLQLSDVPELTALCSENREFLAPWEPLRDKDFHTETKQRALAEAALEAHAAGTRVPLLILNQGGQLAGFLNINGIVRGSLQSASLGYWVSRTENGAGLATAAVADAVEHARSSLGLHRLQAETLLHNAGSQRVLAKNGFTRFGMAPKYLKIAGRWQDHELFQKILD